MSTLDTITATALTHGWSVQTEKWGEDGAIDAAIFTRRNPDDRRKVEYVRVELNTLGRIKAATWAPAQDGLHARYALRDYKAWAITKLSRGAQ